MNSQKFSVVCLEVVCLMAGFTPGLSMAEEKKTYTQPPFAAFESQMNDALLGNDKYEKPVWNLHDTLNLPKWLSLSVEQRTRYETMDGSFKAGGKGGDQQIPLQTDVFAEMRFNHFRFGAEFLDAREFGSDSSSGVNNTHVDEADLLQGYLAWSDQNFLHSGLGTEIIAGRQTLNFGSRRLIARNAMRNTINSFDGLRLRVLDYGNWQFNAFATMPVNRYPSSAVAILDGEHDFDTADGKTWFSGGFFEMYNIGFGVNAEMYLYHLDEGDSAKSQTRNRRYFTPGGRLYIKPAKGEFDFQLETIGQFGTVRTSTTNNKELQHEAWYQHFDLGYTVDMAWKPRVAVLYDYASGDENPTDNKDGRFDTLYGARRFEFGATGIYGAFARANINSPGYSLGFSPRSDVQVGLSHRFYWLAEKKDAWTTSGLVDATGKTDDYIGHQIELTTRWDVNSSLGFETGWAHLFKGEFAKNAPKAPENMDIDYFYVQSQLRF
jgi:hypothetical protein